MKEFGCFETKNKKYNNICHEIDLGRFNYPT